MKWTEQEETFLSDNYNKYGVIYCSKELNKSYSSITGKAKRLGLSITGPDRKRTTNSKYDNQLFEKELDCIRIEDYITGNVSILHECIEGHRFKARPNNILQESSHCPHCANRGIQLNLPTILYLVSFTYERNKVYKLGITSRDVKSRYKGEFSKLNMEVEWVKQFDSGHAAYEKEQYLLKKYQGSKINTGLLKAGNTETFNVYIEKE